MTKYDELISLLKRAVTPDDVVAGVLSQLRCSRLPKDPLRMHGAICKLREEYPDLLGEFFFFQGNLYPYSELLSRVLFRLEASGVLTSINDEYLVTDGVKEELRRRIMPRLEDQEKIASLAQRLEVVIQEMMD